MVSLGNIVRGVACLTCAASIVTATPIRSNETKDKVSLAAFRGETFRISQVYNPTYSAFGPAAYAKALQKYNVVLPQELVDAIPIRAGGATTNDTVAATPIRYDNEYLCPVQIGTPPQTLYLDFDTGSSDLWVFSTETAPFEVQNQTLYKPGNSSSATLLRGATWKISYADNSNSSGGVYLDTVSVGPVTVIQQAVESAFKVSFSFSINSETSGLLGLAFDSLNTVSPYRQKTFFSNASPSLASPLFTANLKRGATGNYNFGFIDHSEHTGSITYIPIKTTQGFWQFNAAGYAIGSTGNFVNMSIDAIADTGTTLLLLPDEVVLAYWSEVIGAAYDFSQGGYVFPCTAALPDFRFHIGRYRGKVPGRYFNYAPVNRTSCYGGLQSSAEIGFSIFGNMLLKSQFVVFDAGNERLGWAPKMLTS